MNDETIDIRKHKLEELQTREGNPVLGVFDEPHKPIDAWDRLLVVFKSTCITAQFMSINGVCGGCQRFDIILKPKKKYRYKTFEELFLEGAEITSYTEDIVKVALNGYVGCRRVFPSVEALFTVSPKYLANLCVEVKE